MAFRDLGKSRYTPNNFFCLTFSRVGAFGTSIELAETNLLIYNIARFGIRKFLTCILPIHFVQGPWAPHNYAQERRRAGGPPYS